MRRRLPLCVLAITIACAEGCGTSQSVAPLAARGTPSPAPASSPVTSPTPAATPTSTPTATPVPSATLAPTIAGLVTFPGDVAVPANARITVTGPATIVAGGNLQLDGAVTVAPSASLAIFADGNVTLDGSVTYGTASPATAARHAASDGRDASPAPAATPSPFTIDAGSITYNGKSSTAIALQPGQDLVFADTSGTGTLTVVSAIALPAAAPALTALASGSIEFGSDSAIAATLASAKAAGISKTATKFGKAIVGGFLIAGAGYDGASDTTGVYDTATRTYSFNGFLAGTGGNVEIGAGEIDVAAGVDILGGAGGCGGAVGAVEHRVGALCTTGEPFFNKPLNGVNDGDSGISITARTGSGGFGGAVKTSGKLVLAPGAELIGGAAGGRGLLQNVYPGNGGGGGNGGSINVEFGSDGCQGAVNGVEQACSRYDFTSPIYTLDGGGNAGAGGNSVGGGIGGSFTLRDFLGKPFAPPKGSFAVVLTNSGNGGTGQNGCQGVNGSPGGSGGAGGTLKTGAVNYAISMSFAGGRGGPGVPGGKGGSGGIDDTGHSIGAPGLPGPGC